MKPKRSLQSQLPLLLIACCALTLCALSQTPDDPLPRRAYFGVGLEENISGARVTSISPGSTAADVGILVGDVIVSVDGATTANTAAVITAVVRHRSGDKVSIGTLRNGEPRTIDAALKPYPSEQMQNATVRYSSVQVKDGPRLRTITSVPLVPKNERFPAVLLIPGGGCGSVDTPLSPLIAQPGLMHAIGSQGFVTMRVDKSGVGDSQGPPCASIGFKEELEGYRAALAALRADPAVDPKRVFLIGVSLGGLFAPLLAAETPVAGISVFGTPGAPTPPYPGRSDRFFEEFDKVDISGAWAKVATRVLVLHGEYDDDPVVSRSVHETIAAVINKSNPGSAEFRELAQLDHCWSRHTSLESSKDKCGQGAETSLLADTILAFLRS